MNRRLDRMARFASLCTLPAWLMVAFGLASGGGAGWVLGGVVAVGASAAAWWGWSARDRPRVSVSLGTLVLAVAATALYVLVAEFTFGLGLPFWALMTCAGVLIAGLFVADVLFTL